MVRSMLPRRALRAASRSIFSNCPLLFWSSALASSESSLPCFLSISSICSRNSWNSSSDIDSASCTPCPACLMISPSPEKYRSNSSSKIGTSLARLTIVARRAERKMSRSASPARSLAANASSTSATETRSPFWRSRLANSTSFSSMRTMLRAGAVWPAPPLVQKILVAAARSDGPAAARFGLLEVVLQLFLRLAHVAFVLDDRVQRLIDQGFVQGLDVEQRQRLDPVQALADARGLLEVKLAQRLDHIDHLLGQLVADVGDLGLDDPQLLLLVGEVDVQVQAAALERVGHFAGVVGGENHQRQMPGLERPEFRHRDLEVGEQLEQKGFELGVGLVDLVDQQHAGLIAANRTQQRAGQDEAVGEEDLVLAGNALHGLGQAARAMEHLADLVL